MHLKVWHADSVTAYLGSANADWKSLAQVKEMGVLLNGTDGAATADLGRVFETFWRWADRALTPEQVTFYSDAYQAPLTMPPWDPAVPKADSGPSPLLRTSSDHSIDALTSLTAQQPLCLTAGGGIAPPDPGADAATAFVSASPGGAVTPGRVPDLDALLCGGGHFALPKAGRLDFAARRCGRGGGSARGGVGWTPRPAGRAQVHGALRHGQPLPLGDGLPASVPLLGRARAQRGVGPGARRRHPGRRVMRADTLRPLPCTFPVPSLYLPCGRTPFGLI